MFKELEEALDVLKDKQARVAEAESIAEAAKLELATAKTVVQKLHEDYLRAVASVVNTPKSVSH